MMQAPWYPIVGMGLTLMRMGQAKSAWIDGAVYAVMALPSVAAIGLSLYALYRWRSARWIPLAVTLSCASLLGGCWIVRLLWDEFAAQVLHSSNANWPYL